MANSAYASSISGSRGHRCRTRQVRALPQERIAPRANEIDRSKCVPKGFVAGIGDLGFLE